MTKKRRRRRRRRTPSRRPAWAERDRSRDLEWILENLEFLWPIAQQGYQEQGRGIIAIDTTRRPLPTAGHPFAFIPQEVVEQDKSDPDTRRMVREYNPANEMVVLVFKPQRRSSTYSVVMPTCYRCGHLLSGEFVFIEKQLETAWLSCPRCGLQETTHPGGILRTAPRMQKVITQAADKHGLDLAEESSYLRLEMEGYDPLVIEKIGRHLVKIGHYYEHRGRQIADPEIVFHIGDQGWIPTEVTLGIGGRRRYASVINDGETIIGVHPKDQADLAHFANGTWAINIETQGWLEHASQREPPNPAKTQPPDLKTLKRWFEEGGGCEATDGCWVEPDGMCPHGCKSWLLVMGLI